MRSPCMNTQTGFEARTWALRLSCGVVVEAAEKALYDRISGLVRMVRSPWALPTLCLLHQWHPRRNIVFHDGPDFVLDLQVTRHFSHWQHFAELRRVGAL